jgi:HPt (histidine-containing phosphotransfer) domain-containing protein
MCEYLDEQVIKLSFGDNQGLGNKSMEIYLRDAPDLMSRLDAAIEAPDFKEASALAHALKGISGYYTQKGPFDLARRLDQTAKKDPNPENRAEIRSLSLELQRALTALTTAMHKHLES